MKESAAILAIALLSLACGSPKPGVILDKATKMEHSPQEGPLDIADAALDKLKDLPTGLRIDVSPNPVYPEATRVKAADGSYFSDYIYTYNIRVSSLVHEQLNVVEYSTLFLKDNTHWTASSFYKGGGGALGPSMFAEHFSCLNATLESGATYAAENHVRDSSPNNPIIGMWYIVAADHKGKQYKGAANIVFESLSK